VSYVRDEHDLSGESSAPSTFNPSGAVPERMPAAPDNVLFVFTDQQRQDSLGCYGGAPDTPHLDALAESGTRFDRGYTPTAICSPARAAVVSGMRPHRNGVTRNVGEDADVDLHERCPCYPGLLRAAGYNVGLAGKWHVGDPHDFGFDGPHLPGWFYPRENEAYLEYLDERDLPPLTASAVSERFPELEGAQAGARDDRPVEASFTSFVTETALDALEDYAADYREDDRPFYQSVHYFGPHNPFYLPEPYWSMYDPGDVELSESAVKETFANKPRSHRHQHCVSGLQDIPLADWRRIVARYRGWVTFIDDEIGRLLDALDAAGVREDTLIVFAADHGSFLTRHKMHDKGPAMYEDIYNVPFIVAGLDGPRTETDVQAEAEDRFVSLLDLAPTFLETAGVDVPAAYDGRSLFDLARDGTAWREVVRAEFHGHQYPYEQRMLRDERYKLVINQEDTAELYDLDADPNELDNRIGDPTYGRVAERLHSRLREAMDAEGDEGIDPHGIKLSGTL
jgi:arylsulfatase A-like enzyme